MNRKHPVKLQPKKRETELHDHAQNFFKLLEETSVKGVTHPAVRKIKFDELLLERQAGAYDSVGTPMIYYVTDHEHYDVKSLLSDTAKAKKVSFQDGKKVKRLGVTFLSLGVQKINGLNFLLKARTHQGEHDPENNITLQFFHVNEGEEPSEEVTRRQPVAIIHSSPMTQENQEHELLEMQRNNELRKYGEESRGKETVQGIRFDIVNTKETPMKFKQAIAMFFFQKRFFKAIK